MTTGNLILIGVGAAAVLAAVAAFAIAFRRSAPGWSESVDPQARRSDRSPTDVVSAPPSEELVPPAEPEASPAEPVTPSTEAVGLAVAVEQRVVEVDAEEAGVTRRQFFNRAMTATFGTFMGLFGLYSLSFLWPRLSGGFGSDVNAGKASDLLAQTRTPEGLVIPVFIPEARAYVVPAPADVGAQFAELPVTVGGVMALFQRCVHLGCRVPWCDSSQGFECPCHGSKYDVVGEYFAGPAPRNLDRFEVELNGAGELIIKTGTILQTPRAPERIVQYPQGPSCIGARG